MLPLLDKRPGELYRYALALSRILLGKEFRALLEELEELYAREGLKSPRRLAFVDALYALMAEQEVEERLLKRSASV